MFLHFAGREISEWTDCLARLRKPEFHLYNRRIEPLTAVHAFAARRVNQRPGCRAFVSGKRALENYLHPEAIRAARGIDLQFGDHDPVAALAAERCFESRPHNQRWRELPMRARLQLIHKAKRWLYTGAVERMTVDRLAQSDAAGEIATWLRTIRLLAEGGS